MQTTTSEQKEGGPSSAIHGTWTSYTTKGIHSPAINVHSFDPDGTYTKIMIVEPPVEAKNADAAVVLTAYRVTGRYSVKESSVSVTINGETVHWQFEMDVGVLFLTSVDGEDISVTLLSRVHGGVPSNPRRE